MTPLDLCVLTGFLGSGKTTLLRDYLASPEGAGTAVIVNEAGEVGLDGALLAEGRTGLPITLLANGCVCCAVGADLIATIEDLLADLPAPPARIVLETSGISKPGAILRGLQLRPTIPLRVRVVSTFDSLGHAETAAFEEAAAQWAGAQALVLTRLDLATPEQIQAASRMATAINPLALIIAAPTLALAQALAANLPAPTPQDDTPAHPRIAARFARQTGPIAWDALATGLDALTFRLGERLLRVKGLVRLEGDAHATLIQAVGTLFSAPRPFGGPAVTSGLTVITRDTTTSELAAVLGELPLEVTIPNRLALRPADARRVAVSGLRGR